MTATIGIGPLTSNHTGPLGGPGNAVTPYDSGVVAGVVLSVSFSFSATISGYQGTAWDAYVRWYNLAGTEIGVVSLGTKHYNTNPTATLNAVAPAGTVRLRIETGSAQNSPDTATIVTNGSYVIGASIDSVGSDVGALTGTLDACCIELNDKLDLILAAVRKTYTSF